MYFHYFVIIYPWKRAGSFIWKKLRILFNQGCFVPSLVKIGPVVLEKNILKVVNLFSLIPNYLPFGKGVALHLHKLESPSPRDILYQVWLQLAQWFWRRWKCEKFTDRRTDRKTTDDRWSESSLEVSAQVSYKRYVSKFRLRYGRILCVIYCQASSV